MDSDEKDEFVFCSSAFLGAQPAFPSSYFLNEVAGQAEDKPCEEEESDEEDYEEESLVLETIIEEEEEDLAEEEDNLDTRFADLSSLRVPLPARLPRQALCAWEPIRDVLLIQLADRRMKKEMEEEMEE